MVKHILFSKQQNEQTDPQKILLLLGAPFTKQNYERIGIPFLARNFTVIVFQCMDWIERGSATLNLVEENWELYEEVESEKQFAQLLEHYKPDYAIDFIGLDPFSPKIGQTLKSQNVKLVIQKLGSQPHDRELYLRFKRKLTSKIEFNSQKSLQVKSDLNVSFWAKLDLKSKQALICMKQRLNQKLLPFKLRLKTPYITLLAGNKSRSILTRMAKETIWASSNDFHTFQKINRVNVSLYPKDYLVFLDDCLTQALDWTTLKMSPPVIHNVYFSQLNGFFQMLEDEHSVSVVIAGHPNTVNDKFYANNFNGRAVIYGKTAELVLYSRSVLLHASTSVSYAVLSKKPITSITSKELDLSHYGKSIRSVSRAVGSNLVFMDVNYKDKILSSQIDLRKYKSYEINFLRNQHSNEDNPWDTFTDFVLRRRLGKL
jgi:hypothetical protein